jgi:L,D-peptidoglycan transpeptidase YkuD (ErfK/YbiS/YcfS/YnhG family)
MVQARVGGGIIRLQGATWRVALGRGGVRVGKQEGDGATPAGLLPLRRVFYRADRGPPPLCAVPVEALAPEDGWCDDPGDRRYNTRVRRPCDARHEALWRDDEIYDVCGVLGWNDAPVERGRGSAIFLHLARPDWRPTDGCIAMAAGDLRALLAAGLTEILVEAGG